MNATLTAFPLAASLLLIGGSIALGASAPISTEHDTLSVSVEIGGLKTEKNVALTLTLTGERSCASVHDKRGSISREVKICREGGEPSAPILRFVVQQHESMRESSASRSFELTSRAPVGETITIARYADGAAPAMELRATAKR